MKKIFSLFLIAFVVWLSISLSLLAFAKELVYDQDKETTRKASFNYEKDHIVFNDEGDYFEVWYKALEGSNEVILYLHGNTGRYPYYIKQLCPHANVLSPSYPGFYPSQGTPSTESINRCALLSVEYLLKKGFKESQITVWGHSLGGSPALFVAQKYPLLKKVVLINTFDSIKKMGMRRYGPFAYFADHIHNSIELAKKARAKIRQFHVIEDDIVPLQAGLNLYKYIASADKRFILLDEGDHMRFDIWKTLHIDELPNKGSLFEPAYLD